MERYARLISYILSPLFLVPFLLILVSVKFSTSASQLFMTLAIIIVASILPILATLGLFMKLGWISDWGISIRRERYVIDCIGLIFAAITLFTLQPLAASSVTYFLMFIFIELIVFSLITFFSKISAHTSSVTLFVFMLIVLFGKVFVISIFLIPLVIWSRVYLGRHTIFQALSGVFITLLIFSFFYRIF